MNKSLVFLIALPTLAIAEPYTVERTLKDSTTMVALDLNASTVFCTDRGYSNIQLKVSVPDLDVLAHFDHRVVGEDLPCITGGLCGGDLTPDAVIDAKEPIVFAPIRVILKETLTIDHDAKSCTRSLTERISSLIRGRLFNHERSSDAEPLAFEKCKKLSQIP